MSLIVDYKAQFANDSLGQLIKTRQTVIDEFLPDAEEQFIAQVGAEHSATSSVAAPYLNLLQFSAALDELIAEKLYEQTGMTDQDVFDCIEANQAVSNNHRHAQEVLLQADLGDLKAGIKGGAPLNEYDIEADIITNAATRGITPERLAELVRYAFEKTFERDELTSEQCLVVAQALLDGWDQKGLSDPDYGELLLEERIDAEFAEYDEVMAQMQEQAPTITLPDGKEGKPSLCYHYVMRMAYYHDGGKAIFYDNDEGDDEDRESE